MNSDMDTKEAIEFLELHRWKNPRDALTLEGFKSVEILLQRGEKYKVLYEVLADSVGIIAKDFEQRHFPTR